MNGGKNYGSNFGVVRPCVEKQVAECQNVEKIVKISKI
jgi:hypothetical protein